MNFHPTRSRSLPQPSPMKKAAKLDKALALIALALFLAGAAHASTLSFSSNAPVVVLASVSISNLVGAPVSPAHGTDFAAQSNVGTGDGTYTYIADDKAAVGQSFTTGTNAAGYKVVAVTLRAVIYSTFSWVPSVNYNLRITKPGAAPNTNT